MKLCYKILLFLSFVLLANANKDFNKKDGVKASKATSVSVINEAEDGDGRAPACIYRCPGGIWCCNYRQPICAGNGYCCPKDRRTVWVSYCY